MITALAQGAIPRPVPQPQPAVVVEVMLDPRTLRLRSEVRDAASNRVLLRLGPQPEVAPAPRSTRLDIRV